MSPDTGIGSTSGSLRPGVIAVGVNEDLYCLFNSGDLVKGFRHADRRYPFRSAETGHKKPATRRRRVAWSQTGSKGVQAARMNGRPSSSDVLSCLEIDRLRAAPVLLDLEAHFLPFGQMT